MTSTQRFALRIAFAAAAMVGGAQARAVQIDLGLNLIYNDPSDSNSGGVWQVIGSSDGFGIHTVSFALTDINPSVERAAPFGVVNAGADDAGFSFLADATVDGVTSVFIGHDPLPPTGPEVGEIYGFGTQTNGAPSFAGTPSGANVEPGSPFLSTLVLTPGSLLPWASGDEFGDPAFDQFATIATGTFDPGDTPAFVENAANPQGRVFTEIGDATTLGVASLSADTLVTLLAPRDNLIDLADYNGDGIVSAADYTVFRDTFGQTVPTGTGADGDGSGEIDLGDFNAFVADFGETAGSVATALSVPEPSSVTLLVGVVGAALLRRSRRRLSLEN